MKYAIISLSGKQHKVEVGQELVVDHLDQEPGKKFTISDVFMVMDGDKAEVGTPLVKQVVTAEVIDHKKGEKVRVATYKAKSRYRKVKGHRQHQTTIKIISIGAAPKKTVKSAPKKTAAKKQAKTAK